MFSNKFFTFFKNFFIFLFFLISLTSCEAIKFKRTDVKDVPINDADKRQKNFYEG